MAVLAPLRSAARRLIRAALRRPAPVARSPIFTDHLDPAPDLEGLLRDAGTDLEKDYFAHRGRPMFKWTHYLPLYDRALRPFVGKSPRVLEIGLAQGGSLQLWRRYLGDGARIVGLDLDRNCIRFEADGFPIYIGDQSDPDLLEKISADHGPFDVVIDDGSHISKHQIASFKALFPKLNPGGVYICEDLHTSYWPGWGGGLGRDDTFVHFIKTLMDKMHDKYFRGAEVEDSTPEEIEHITFADSIAFLHKRVPTPSRMVMVGSDPAA